MHPAKHEALQSSTCTDMARSSVWASGMAGDACSMHASCAGQHSGSIPLDLLMGVHHETAAAAGAAGELPWLQAGVVADAG